MCLHLEHGLGSISHQAWSEHTWSFLQWTSGVSDPHVCIQYNVSNDQLAASNSC